MTNNEATISSCKMYCYTIHNLNCSALPTTRQHLKLQKTNRLAVYYMQYIIDFHWINANGELNTYGTVEEKSKKDARHNRKQRVRCVRYRNMRRVCYESLLAVISPRSKRNAAQFPLRDCRCSSLLLRLVTTSTTTAHATEPLKTEQS